VRLNVVGQNETADALRGTLRLAGYVLSTYMPHLTIYVDEGAESQPIVDGVDSPLERSIVNEIAKLTPSGNILLQRGEGIGDAQSIRVVSPAIPAERAAVETGIRRGIDRIAQKPQSWEFWKK
jgi:hypothetical protein